MSSWRTPYRSGPGRRLGLYRDDRTYRAQQHWTRPLYQRPLRWNGDLTAASPSLVMVRWWRRVADNEKLMHPRASRGAPQNTYRDTLTPCFQNTREAWKAPVLATVANARPWSLSSPSRPLRISKGRIRGKPAGSGGRGRLRPQDNTSWPSIRSPRALAAKPAEPFVAQRREFTEGRSTWRSSRSQAAKSARVLRSPESTSTGLKPWTPIPAFRPSISGRNNRKVRRTPLRSETVRIRTQLKHDRLRTSSPTDQEQEPLMSSKHDAYTATSLWRRPSRGPGTPWKATLCQYFALRRRRPPYIV